VDFDYFHFIKWFGYEFTTVLKTAFYPK